MGSAATWVTVILFSEVTRRAMKTMSKGNLIVLLHAAGVMMAGSAMIPGGPFGELVYRAFLVTSDAARDMGERGRRAAAEAAAGLDRLWLALQAHLPAAPSRGRR